MGLRRTLADLAERATGSIIIRPEELHSVHEEQHLARFFQYFDIDCVFDVGANRGQYARRLRDRVGFRGPIISFEPIPALAATLQVMAAASRDWIIRDVALGAASGRAVLNIMAEDQFSSLRSPDVSRGDRFEAATRVVETVEVPVSTLKDELAAFERRLHFRRPFLKMDTQGHDLAVATGAGRALSSFAGIQSEVSFTPIYSGSPGYGELIRFYEQQGFTLSALVPNNEGHFPLLVEMDCILYRTDLQATPRT